MHANPNMSGTFLIKDGPAIECGKGKRLVDKDEAEKRLQTWVLSSTSCGL